MAKPQKVLCVCFGNSDRSPIMAAVLGMYLKNAQHDNVMCESAGINDDKFEDDPAPFCVMAAKRLGLDISGHKKRHISEFDLNQYDLIIVVDDVVAGVLVDKYGVQIDKIFNVQISNPWPCQFQEQYEPTVEQVIIMMYRVVRFYFA